MLPSVAVDDRVVPAVHAQRTAVDVDYLKGLVLDLKENYDQKGLVELYGRFSAGDGMVDNTMRKAIVNAAAHRCGPGLRIDSNVGFRHLEPWISAPECSSATAPMCKAGSMDAAR